MSPACISCSRSRISDRNLRSPDAFRHPRRKDTVILNRKFRDPFRCQNSWSNRSQQQTRTGLGAVDSISSVDQSTTHQILAGLEGNQEELLRSSDAFWKVTPPLSGPLLPMKIETILVVMRPYVDRKKNRATELSETMKIFSTKSRVVVTVQ
jgi:hypothetical protein